MNRCLQKEAELTVEKSERDSPRVGIIGDPRRVEFSEQGNGTISSLNLFLST